MNYEDTFSQAALKQIQGILIADAIASPLLRFVDLGGIYNRYIKAPTVHTQQEMDILWSPQDWSLAERYTDILKTIFVGLMYAVPLPSGLFITAVALLSTYVVDKYSLCRVWRRPPALDDRLSKLNRFFMISMLWAHLFFSRIFFANWPYPTGIDDEDQADCGFFLCSSRVSVQSDSNAGKVLTVIYNIGTIAMFIVVAAWLSHLSLLSDSLVRYFLPVSYSQELEAVGKKGGEERKHTAKFRDLGSMSAYVPMITPSNLHNPILLADVRALPPQHAPVHDKERSFRDGTLKADPSEFSVVNDVEFPGKTSKELARLFGEVKYYDPPAIQTAGYSSHLYQDADEEDDPLSPDSKRRSFQRASFNAANKVQALKIFVDDQGEALPFGWEMKDTGPPDHKVYYVNHTNRTTSWTRPEY